MPAAGSDPSDGSVAKLIELAGKPTLGERLTEWGSRPPGRLYIPACGVLGLVLLFEDSVPGGHLAAFSFGLAGGLFLAAMGALRFGIALSVARPVIRPHWLRWICPPLIAATALGLAVTGVPLQARVLSAADELLSLREGLTEGERVGLEGATTGSYALREVSVSGGIAHYAVEGAGLFTPAGLAHSPEEDLPEGVFVPGQGSRIYEHVDGDWYVWVDH
ncbi:hypothetical protein [Nocardiopsis sp. LOL_012]|uniref:hypothetical protein n=1 Tax=Nocardiopsis sp. LOL_012 TaxID=3345409 RepID=UPI003A847065